MKKLYMFVAALLVGGAAFFVWSQAASAQSFHTGTNVILTQRQEINQTVYAAGQTIDISANVVGDIFCAGQTVTISGDVHGDVICAGQTVTVTGHVFGDVRLAGQSVTVSAKVDGNATIGAQTFKLSSIGSIGGDVTVGSTSTSFDGTVGRNVVSGGDTVAFANTVGGDSTVAANHVELLPGAALAGDLQYTSNNKVQQSDGSSVAGTVSQKKPPQKQSAAKQGALFGFGIAFFVYLLAAFLFTALILSLAFPQMFHAVTNQAVARPWVALLVGFISTIVVPVLILLVAITVIGIPLAILLAVAWFLIVMLSSVFFAQYLGRLVFSGTPHPALSMLVGAAILVLASFVPILGFISFLAALWFGTGMILMELFRRTPKPAYEVASTAPKTKK